MFRFTTLRWQLLGSYIPLIAIPVLLVNLVTRGVTDQRVDTLLEEGQQRQGKLFTECLAGFYEQNGSWEGLDTALKPLPSDQVLFYSQAQQSAQNNAITINQTDDAFRVEVQFLNDPLISLNANCLYLLEQRVTRFFTQRGQRPFWSMPGRRWRAGEDRNDPHKPRADAVSPFTTDVLVGTPASPPVLDNNGTLIAMPMMPRDPRAPMHAMPIRSVEELPQGLVVVGANGTVVASSNPQIAIGVAVDMGVVTEGFPIRVDAQQVGTAFFSAARDVEQQELVNAVDHSLVVAGLLSMALAAVLGWELSRRITAPARELMMGVKRLGAGEWSKPLHVHANNEFGALTHAFNNMASEITRQHQMNRQMVADIAHDLRTPLSAMALEVDAIEAGYQSPQEAVASLREEITWLQRMVEDLRLLSLIDADQIKLQRTPTPLRDFLCMVLDFWQPIAEDADRRLEIAGSPDLPTVAIDQARMRQILGNLIDNAIRHTKPGGQIMLGAQVEGAKIAIWVQDDGEGIAPDDLARIFDRFYRSDPSRTHTNTGGSGLGLSITRRLVEMHGGTIEAHSEPGKGATFIVRLPG
jgi:signal transduction histidine kinase